MRKIITGLFSLFLFGHIVAQVPEAFSYQAIIRNIDGSILANQDVGLQISIIIDSIDGAIVYVETFDTTTNTMGLVNLAIGNGLVVTGEFSAIPWNSDKCFLKIEVDPNGGTSYIEMGTSQLLSVPYALHAKTAENIIGASGYLINIEANVSSITCGGLENGAIDITVSGGVPPYKYKWYEAYNDPVVSIGLMNDTIEDISGLKAGLYTVNVFDQIGQVESKSIIVDYVSEMIFQFTTQPASTLGGSDGSIGLVVNGGIPPYTYLWSNGATSASISGLTAGVYSVTVTDANGCEKSHSLYLGENIGTLADADGIIDTILNIYKGQGDYNNDGSKDDYLPLIYLLSDLQTDNAQHAGMDTNFSAFATFSLTPWNAFVESIWYLSYEIIDWSNRLLGNINSIEGATTEERDNIKGEALLLRAYAYSILVEKFGSVPLYKYSGPGSHLTNSTAAEVYAQIEEDLQSAIFLLPSSVATNTEISSRAAYALLARILLRTEEWANASTCALSVNDSSEFSLCSSYDSVFTHTPATEVIWKLGFDGPEKNMLAYYTFPSDSGGIKEVTIRQNLVDTFEIADIRDTTIFFTAGSDHIIYKYRDPVNGDYDIPVLRYAEMLLICAEAQNEMGNVSSALESINSIRNRAGLTDLSPATTQNELRGSVYLERRLELSFEGHRWNDLVRTNAAQTVLGDLGTTVLDYQLLWPIPQRALNENPELTQNPGY